MRHESIPSTRNLHHRNSPEVQRVGTYSQALPSWSRRKPVWRLSFQAPTLPISYSAPQPTEMQTLPEVHAPPWPAMSIGWKVNMIESGGSGARDPKGTVSELVPGGLVMVSRGTKDRADVRSCCHHQESTTDVDTKFPV